MRQMQIRAIQRKGPLTRRTAEPLEPAPFASGRDPAGPARRSGAAGRVRPGGRRHASQESPALILSAQRHRARAAGRGGFTLIEMLIVVAVTAILASVAYPSYQAQVRKTRRADATAALSSLAAQLEKYAYDRNGSYSGATLAGLGGSATSPEGHYGISIPTLSARTYEIRATPLVGSPQTSDGLCGAFVLQSTGEHDVTGSCGSSHDDCVDLCW